MSFSIGYDTTSFANYGVSSYLDDWLANFGDANHTSGNVDDSNSGGFYGGTQLSGTQYALSSPTNQTSAFIAGGSLTYDMSTHILSGSLDSLDFGDVLSGGDTGAYSLQDSQASFNGLGFASEGSDGVVHQAIYGLMTGRVDPAEQALASIFDSLLGTTDSYSNQNSVFHTATFGALDGNSDGTVTEAEITAYAAGSAAADAVTTVGIADAPAELLVA